MHLYAIISALKNVTADGSHELAAHTNPDLTHLALRLWLLQSYNLTWLLCGCCLYPICLYVCKLERGLFCVVLGDPPSYPGRRRRLYPQTHRILCFSGRSFVFCVNENAISSLFTKNGFPVALRSWPPNPSESLVSRIQSWMVVMCLCQAWLDYMFELRIRLY